MFKIFTISILLTIITLADGPVLKTGQTLSYDENGALVTDGSVKDDGYYQTGVSRDYSRNGDIVIDNSTGLQWEDNESITKRWFTWENFNAGNYNDTSGDTAMTYCEDFTLGGYTDWRLPTIEELNTLSDEGKYDPALSDGIFQNYGLYTYAYWSSTTYANYSLYAWGGRI